MPYSKILNAPLMSAAGIIIVSTAGPALAAPVDYSAFAYSKTGGFSDNFEISESTSEASFNDPSEGTRARSRANIPSAMLQDLSFSAPPSGINRAGTSTDSNIYDILQFDRDATLSYSFDVDGSLEISGENDQAGISSFIRIADVTDINNVYSDDIDPRSNGSIYWTEETEDQTIEAFYYGKFLSGSNLLAGDETFSDPDGISIFNGSAEGMPQEVSYTITGSFDVAAGNYYAIQLSQQSNAVADQGEISEADFLATSIFSFTDLDGASYSSASGAFLDSSEVPAPVPLPATFPLALLGLGGISLVARSRRK